jgi:hypothetical protein
MRIWDLVGTANRKLTGQLLVGGSVKIVCLRSRRAAERMIHTPSRLVASFLRHPANRRMQDRGFLFYLQMHRCCWICPLLSLAQRSPRPRGRKQEVSFFEKIKCRICLPDSKKKHRLRGEFARSLALARMDLKPAKARVGKVY